jgi:hypothetical protein
MTTDDFSISTVEDAVLSIFCREPEAVHLFDAPASDILNPTARQVVGAAQEIKRGQKQQAPIILEEIAAMTGLALAVLEQYGRRVTRRMQEDWRRYAKLIRLAAQKRAELDWLVAKQDELVRTPLLKLPAWNAATRLQFVEMTPNLSPGKPTEAGALLRSMMRKDSWQAPVPTGVPFVDNLTMGGLRPHQVHVIGGAFGSGKTTLMRNITYNMAFSGQRVVHLAYDGGVAQEHMASYVAMRAMYYCLGEGVTTKVYGYTGDALHPDNVAIWIANQDPDSTEPNIAEIVPITPQVHEMLLRSAEDYFSLADRGYLAVVDTETLGPQTEEVLTYIEREHHDHGAVLFAIDHVGKLGDKRKQSFFDRFDVNAQLLVDLVGSLPIVGLFLAQRTAAGVAKHNLDTEDEDADQDYSAHLEGGRVWQQEAHTVWVVRRPQGKPYLKVKPKKLRKEENAVSTTTIPLHLPSGLILPPDTQQIGFV